MNRRAPKSLLTYRRTLLLVLLVALALRLAAGWGWQSRLAGRFGMGDSESYWTLAAAIAHGEPYECGPERAKVFRTPGYPILLAPIIRLAGDTNAALLLARAEAALLGTLAVAAVWRLARLLFDQRVALVAATLAALYPGAIVLSALVLSEAPFCPLMLAQLALWTLAWRADTRTRMITLAVCAGLVAGAATLMRPSWLLFTPLAILVSFAAAQDRAERWKQLCVGGCLLAGLSAAMLPWWVRNACLTGRFVPTTLQVGASLYDGLNPQANGGSNMDHVQEFTARQGTQRGQVHVFGHRSSENGTSLSRKMDQSPTLQSSNGSIEAEVRLDRRLRQAAVDWATGNPAQVAKLAAIKVLRLWNVWPNEPRFSSWPIRLTVFFTYTPLLFFAIIGAWRTLGRGWPYLLCWLPAVYFTLLHAVFVSSIRYREPAMLALIVLAGPVILSVAKNLGGLWQRDPSLRSG